jgi:hypothetical protein
LNFGKVSSLVKLLTLDSIFEEIEKHNNFVGSNESDFDKNQRIVNTVFSQLYPICDNMLTFMLEKEKIKELISGFSKQYGLSQDLDDHLIKMVEDYKYEEKEVYKPVHKFSEETRPFAVEDLTSHFEEKKLITGEDLGFADNYVMIENTEAIDKSNEEEIKVEAIDKSNEEEIKVEVNDIKEEVYHKKEEVNDIKEQVKEDIDINSNIESTAQDIAPDVSDTIDNDNEKL